MRDASSQPPPIAITQPDLSELDERLDLIQALHRQNPHDDWLRTVFAAVAKNEDPVAHFIWPFMQEAAGEITLHRRTPYTITAQDMSTLLPGSRLNDEVVDSFLSLLAGCGVGQASTSFAPARMAAIFEQSSDKDAEFLELGVDNNTDRIVIPFRADDHWLLIMLLSDHPKKSWTAQIVDSLQHQTDEHTARASTLVCRLTSVKRRDRSSVFYQWSQVQVDVVKTPKTLRQITNPDSGVCMIRAAIWLVEGSDHPEQVSCSVYRHTMAASLADFFGRETVATAGKVRVDRLPVLLSANKLPEAPSGR